MGGVVIIVYGIIPELGALRLFGCHRVIGGWDKSFICEERLSLEPSLCALPSEGVAVR